ncbi:hypothetical protein ACIPPM_03585 [Streptomyces sp. NPDC090119]|uniref:hypothetical protein n=1 Tax=Streptomyces sp. NPDC090119 TaxID=3365951 RepID=UPI0038073249
MSHAFAVGIIDRFFAAPVAESSAGESRQARLLRLMGRRVEPCFILAVRPAPPP